MVSACFKLSDVPLAMALPLAVMSVVSLSLIPSDLVDPLYEDIEDL
jgi:hypothetical protein